METSLLPQRTSEVGTRAAPTDSAASSGPPTMGILTRTVFRSPVTKLILPARIRQSHKNDVIFVQERSIEIKEYVRGNLEHVTIKDDFGAIIRSAGVIKEPREPMTKVEPEAEADDESARDAILRQSSAMKQPTQDSLDTDDMPHLPEMPPQILVMALQSGPEDSLLFLCASHDEPDAIRFLSHQIPLPAKMAQSKRLGKHIAIDPRSRAMAVSANSGSFVFYALKPMRKLRKEVRGPEGLRKENFRPVTEERHISVNAIIQKMEFLYPSNEDKDHTILLLIATFDEKTKFLVYEWDYSRDLRTIGPPKTYPVPPAFRCPLLLIPFMVITGFVLVCQSSICMYYDILTGELQNKHLSTPEDLDETCAREPGSSRRFPLWTAWARPQRRDNYASENDIFYLCREDGTVQFLEFKLSDFNPQCSFHRTGELLVNVDTAFAALDLGWDRFQPRKANDDNQKESDDILIAAGDMSDGKVVRMAARKNAQSTQSIPNWTPMVDFCTTSTISGKILDEENRRPRSYRISDGRERIFGCVGRGRNHGAVCEMRSGIEARSHIYSQVGDGVTGLWILPDISGTKSGICLLITCLDDTTMLLQIPNSDSVEVPELEDLFGIETDWRTFAAGSTSTGLVVQVTAHSLRVFEPGHSASIVYLFKDERVILACTRSEAILVATDHNGELRLRYAELQISSAHISLDWAERQYLMQTEPSCLSLQVIEGVTYAFVGDSDGKLLLFVASSRDGMSRIFTYNFEKEFAICESVTLLRQDPQDGSRDRYLLLCGLRNGSLETFLFDPGQSGSVNMSHCETVTFGETKVVVIADNTSWNPSRDLCSRAIVLCGGNFCRLIFRLSVDKSYHASIQRIWLTADKDTEIYHSQLSVIAQSDPWSVDPKDESRLLFCVQDDHFYGTELGPSLRPYTVVRHMRAPGTPNRIMFSNHLQKLIVACTTIRVRSVKEQLRDKNKRLLYPTLMFLDPDEITLESALDMKPELHDDNAREGQMLPGRTPRIIGRSGMKVLGLLEWRAKLEGKSFLLLAINSMRPRNEANRITGIINLYTVNNRFDGQVAIKSSGAIKCDHPVYSIAQYDERSLVYTSGNTLNLSTLETIDGTTRLTHRMGWDRLRSQGVYVSVRKPYIYVSTAKHSVSVFVIERNAFRPVFTDEDGARQGLHHLTLPAHPMVIVSDRNGMLAGLWQPPTAQVTNSFKTVFEAVLPGPIRKLHLTHVKAPWSAEEEKGEKVGDAIIGSSLDGSFYRFELIDEAKWRLLRFLQNLCERNGNLCPLMHAKRRRQRLEPHAPTRRDMHIDGDILWRLIERGGPLSGRMIKSMLVEVPDEDSNWRTDEFETLEERISRFSELARDAALGGDSGEDDSVEEAVVRFLRKMLQPIA